MVIDYSQLGHSIAAGLATHHLTKLTSEDKTEIKNETLEELLKTLKLLHSHFEKIVTNEQEDLFETITLFKAANGPAWIYNPKDRLYTYVKTLTSVPLNVDSVMGRGVVYTIPPGWSNFIFPDNTIFQLDNSSSVNQVTLYFRFSNIPPEIVEGSIGVNNPLIISGTPNINVAQFGGVNTQMASVEGQLPANSPEVVVGLLNGSSNIDRWSSANTHGDATSTGVGAVAIYNHNGATWDRIRTSTKFFTAIATAAGNTAIWTPTAGKKFRLLKYQIQVTANASLAAAGIEEITFQDNVTGLNFGLSIFLPNAAGTAIGVFTTGWIDISNGSLSAAANNVLNVNLATALATGEIRVLVTGTEE